MDSAELDAKFTPYNETLGEDYMNDGQVSHFRVILKTGVNS